jgi:hypothetical protein
MPNTSTTLRSDGVSTRLTFAPTPPMSTYLLALVCGPLVSYTLPAAPAPGRPNVLPVTGWAVNVKVRRAMLPMATPAPLGTLTTKRSLPVSSVQVAALPFTAAEVMVKPAECMRMQGEACCTSTLTEEVPVKGQAPLGVEHPEANRVPSGVREGDQDME